MMVTKTILFVLSCGINRIAHMCNLEDSKRKAISFILTAIAVAFGIVFCMMIPQNAYQIPKILLFISLFAISGATKKSTVNAILDAGTGITFISYLFAFCIQAW